MAADQRVAGLTGEGAKSVVDEGDAASRIAQHDQIVLRFEQAAGALLGFLQFPVAVGQRFVVHGDLAQFPAHKRSRMLRVASATQAIANRKLTPSANACGS